jgi:two-component system phosphate regulon sensor histidine kinase PhoR
MQSRSPRTVSLLISLLVAFIGTTILILTVWFQEVVVPILYFPAVFILIFAMSFYAVKIAIERFIYDRIKLLYRSAQIFRSKKTLAEMNLDMRSDVLGEVSKDVARWMLEQHRTIDQLEEREAFRREFIGNLSHELKTPVFSVQGYILTLLEGGIKDKDINVRFLEKAARGVDRITNLLNDLDAISKLESGQLNIIKERFNFNKLAQTVVEDMEGVARKKNIKIDLQIPPEKEIRVMADPDKIIQVLSNFILNAITYGEKDGMIWIRCLDLDTHYLIEVEDNGIGISAKDTQRVFERFYRVEKSRNRQRGGTGLGLAIVKHIIDAHDETVSVRSSPGEGSVFSFSLIKATS